MQPLQEMMLEVRLLQKQQRQVAPLRSSEKPEGQSWLMESRPHTAENNPQKGLSWLTLLSQKLMMAYDGRLVICFDLGWVL